MIKKPNGWHLVNGNIGACHYKCLQ